MALSNCAVESLMKWRWKIIPFTFTRKLPTSGNMQVRRVPIGRISYNKLQNIEMAEFTTQELDIIKQTLFERYGQIVEIQLADVDLRLNPGDRELVSCPAVYWEARSCHFIISKLGNQRFQCQFYYSGSEQFGTGIKDYDDIGICVVTLLQVQADHETQSTKSD